jgi:hypothetical protein
MEDHCFRPFFQARESEHFIGGRLKLIEIWNGGRQRNSNNITELGTGSLTAQSVN